VTNIKIAVVDLMGGFGNQIFQLTFAKYLETNGFKVYINKYWYENQDFLDGTTKRNLEVNIKDFGFEEISKLCLILFNSLDKLSRKRGLKRLFNSKINNIYKLNTGHDFNESQFFVFNRFSGYWQNIEYFKGKEKYILESLNKDTLFASHLSNNNNGKTLVHIRKGDYVNLKEELPYSYFENCLQILNDKFRNIEYDIFSDDINQNLENIIFVNAENIFINKDEKAIETFSKMLNYKNYILSNSSFSFLAAFLSKKKDSEIFYPLPWFKGSKHPVPVLDSWHKVEYE
jgi:hypothetical protein